jgi:hypothetical protein
MAFCTFATSYSAQPVTDVVWSGRNVWHVARMPPAAWEGCGTTNVCNADPWNAWKGRVSRIDALQVQAPDNQLIV